MTATINTLASPEEQEHLRELREHLVDLVENGFGKDHEYTQELRQILDFSTKKAFTLLQSIEESIDDMDDAFLEGGFSLAHTEFRDKVERWLINEEKE
jgi:hypothetical protein